MRRSRNSAIRCELTEGLIGGIAIHKTGKPLPGRHDEKALEADATLMGAVGLPEFDNTPPSQEARARIARHARRHGSVRESAAGEGVAIADRVVAA